MHAWLFIPTVHAAYTSGDHLELGVSRRATALTNGPSTSGASSRHTTAQLTVPCLCPLATITLLHVLISSLVGGGV